MFYIVVLTVLASAILLCKWSSRSRAHAQHTALAQQDLTHTHLASADNCVCSASAASMTNNLSEKDLLDITNYLQSLERPQIYHLGVVLGLSRQKVKGMRESEMFLDEVIASWLRREDEVERRGIPSWKTLVKALRHPRLSQNGIAKDIECDRC